MLLCFQDSTNLPFGAHSAEDDVDTPFFLKLLLFFFLYRDEAQGVFPTLIHPNHRHAFPTPI